MFTSGRARRWRWALAGALTVVGVGAAAICAAVVTPPAPTARVYLSTSSTSTASDLVKRSDYTQQATESFARVATTPIVLRPVIQEFGLHVAPADFAQRVSASVPSNTVLINISVAGGSRRESARLSNAVAEQLVKVSSRISPTGGSERLTLVQVEAARGD